MSFKAMDRGKCGHQPLDAIITLVEENYYPFFFTITLAYHGSCISRHNATNRQGKRNADGEIRRVYEAYTRNAHMPYNIETEGDG